MNELLSKIEGKAVGITMPKADLGGVDYYTKGLMENLREEGYNVVEIEFPESYSGILSSTINSGYFLRQKILSAAEKVDALILSDYSHAMGFNPIKMDPEVFTTVHHIHDPSNPIQRAVHRINTRRLSQTDHIIAASKYTKNELEDKFGLGSIVYDQGVEDYPEGELPEEVEKPYLLYVGNHRPRKNIPLLIETFSKVVEENPEINLALAGNHRGAEEAKELIEEKGLEDRVIITGRVSEEELGRLYRDTELYIHTAEKEGYARTIREAKKKETGVLAVKSPVLEEILEDEELVDPESEQISKRIIKLID